MYKQLFTLSDLFNNKDLKGYLPQIEFKEYTKNDKIYSSSKGFNYLFDEIVMYARIGAMPYMSNVKITRSTTSNDGFYVDGKLRKNATLQLAYDSVLSTLQGASGSLTLLGSYGDTIEGMMREIRKTSKYRMGDKSEPKLWLRINSLQEIKSMNKQQKDALLKNIIENIYFSDDFKPYREPSLERHSFIVNNRNVLMGYDALKRNFDRKVRY